MRGPTQPELQELAVAAAATDTDTLHRVIADIGVPEEIAARWYSYLAELEGTVTVQQVMHYFNLSWT